MTQVGADGKLISIRQKAREIVDYAKKKEYNGVRNLYRQFMDDIIAYYQNKNMKEIKSDLDKFLEPDGIAEAIGASITFKTSQLRKFFNEIKNIKVKVVNENNNNEAIRILTLIPRLAYSYKRNLIDENFYKLMRLLLDKLRQDLNKENFKTFEQIFEAIVAYHKYYGGKED